MSITERILNEDIDTLSLAVEKSCALIDRLRAEKAELLAACKAFVYWYDQDSSEQRRDDAYYDAVAAIAKSEATS